MKRINAFLTLSFLLLATISGATDHSQIVKTSDGKFIFHASRGDVTFNHTAHKRRLAVEGCIPCHKTNNPTEIMPDKRFDERIAHYFCKGCHREKGKGPTECHECHKLNK